MTDGLQHRFWYANNAKVSVITKLMPGLGNEK